MRVVELGKIRELDDNKLWVKCSMCGVYKEPKGNEFFNKEKAEGILKDFPHQFKTVPKQTRTNCEACYNAKDQDAVERNRLEAESSKEHKKLLHDFEKLSDYNSHSIKVSDFIKELKKLPKDARVYIYQEGYYVEGEFGNIGVDSEPEIIMGEEFYSVGSSYQNY